MGLWFWSVGSAPSGASPSPRVTVRAGHVYVAAFGSWLHWGLGSARAPEPARWPLHSQHYLQATLQVKASHRTCPGRTLWFREKSIWQDTCWTPGLRPGWEPIWWAVQKCPPPMLHRAQPSPAGPLAMPQALRPHCEALYPLCPLPGTGFLQNLSPVSSQAWFLPSGLGIMSPLPRAASPRRSRSISFLFFFFFGAIF